MAVGDESGPLPAGQPILAGSDVIVAAVIDFVGTAHNLKAEFVLPRTAQIVKLTATHGTCSVRDGSCTLGDVTHSASSNALIAAYATVRFAPGVAQIGANVTADGPDSNPANQSPRMQIDARAGAGKVAVALPPSNTNNNPGYKPPIEFVGLPTGNRLSITRSGDEVFFQDSRGAVIPGRQCRAATNGRAACPAEVGGDIPDHRRPVAVLLTDADDVVTEDAVNPVIVRAGGGRDILNGTDVTFFGEDGNDQLFGGALHDVLDGGRGADTLFGRGGSDDILLGGEEVEGDTLDGGTGVDRLYWAAVLAEYIDLEAGTARLVTPDPSTGLPVTVADGTITGVEWVEGGNGKDLIQGTDGPETLAGGNGKDRLVGRGGNDHLSGNRDNDDLRGGDGEDTLEGGFGDDELHGGEGNDRLLESMDDDGANSEQNDDLYGNDGDDYLRGGIGADLLDGGDGRDTGDWSDHTVELDINLHDGDREGATRQTDELRRSNEDWGINFGDGSGVPPSQRGDRTEQLENVIGGPKLDILVGTNGANEISGGGGADVIFGRPGDDTIDGGLGGDLIDGGDGQDTVTYGSRSANVRVTLDGHRERRCVRGRGQREGRTGGRRRGGRRPDRRRRRRHAARRLRERHAQRPRGRRLAEWRAPARTSFEAAPETTRSSAASETTIWRARRERMRSSAGPGATCATAARPAPSASANAPEPGGCYPSCRPRSRPAVSSFTPRGDSGALDRRRPHGPHQGSQAGADREARPQRDRHRLSRGPDRDAHPSDQRPHRAPADTREGPLLPARAAEARRPAAAVPHLHAEARPRGLSRPHQGARPQALAQPGRVEA